MIKNGAICEIIDHNKTLESNDYKTRYVLDYRFHITVKEHHFYKDKSGKYNIPKHISTKVIYGDDLKALVAMFVGQGIISSNRITEFLREISEGNLDLSDGTIYNILKKFSEKSKDQVSKIKEELKSSEILHTDETVVRCEKKNMCVKNYSNKDSVLFTANPSKSKEWIEKDNILPSAKGTLIHDHYKVNYNWGADNAECNVHILRYLIRNLENTKNS